MISAIDTNLVSSLWARGPAWEAAEGLLLQARRDGGSVICAPVYAELLAREGVTVAFADGFFASTGIQVEFEMGKKIWQEAGARFSQYARRRKISKGDEPRRLIADFVIGAHAMLRADRLITFNARDFRLDFPELKILDSL